MRFSETLRFALTLIVRKRGRVAVVFLAIMIGSMAMLLFLSFANGLERVVLSPILARSSPTTLIVRPDYRSFDFLTGGTKLTEAVATEIGGLAEVSDIGRQLFLGFPNSLRISLFGFPIETDVPIFGVDSGVLAEVGDLGQSDDDVLPVAISPRLLDLFNASFADALAGIPQLAPDDVLGRELALVFGRSSFFNTLTGDTPPLEQTARVAAISAKLPPIGVSIPLEKATEMNAIFAGIAPEDIVYQQLLVETDTVAAIPAVQRRIEELGFDARSFEELGEEVRVLTETIRVVLFFAALVVLGIAFFALLALITVVIIEQQKNIGILTVLGASKTAVGMVFLLFTGVIVLAAALCGMALGFGGTLVLNALAADIFAGISLFANDLVVFSPLLATKIVGGVLVMALCFTFFPLRSALKTKPLALLWG